MTAPMKSTTSLDEALGQVVRPEKPHMITNTSSIE